MKKVIFLLLAVISVNIISCKKSETSPAIQAPIGNPNYQSTSGPYGSLRSIYNSLCPTPTIITIDPDTSSILYGKSASYSIPSFCFLTQDGTLARDSVQIEINEFLRKGDILFSGVLPAEDGNPLLSSGEVYINATKNGEKLIIGPSGFPLMLSFPRLEGIHNDGMSIFQGYPYPSANGILNWVVADKNQTSINIYSSGFNQFFTDTLGYFSMSKPIDNADFQDFILKISGVTIPGDSSIGAYAIYDDYRSVWAMNNIKDSTIHEKQVAKLPVHFVVFTVVNGYFYGGITAATPSTGATYTVNLLQTDPVKFKATLDSL